MKNNRTMMNIVFRTDWCPPLPSSEVEREVCKIVSNGGYHRPHTPENNGKFYVGANQCGCPLMNIAISRKDSRYGYMKKRKDYDV